MIDHGLRNPYRCGAFLIRPLGPRDMTSKSRDAMRRSKILTSEYVKSEYIIGKSVENLEIFTTGPLSPNDPFSRYKHLKLT